MKKLLILLLFISSLAKAQLVPYNPPRSTGKIIQDEYLMTSKGLIIPVWATSPSTNSMSNLDGIIGFNKADTSLNVMRNGLWMKFINYNSLNSRMNLYALKSGTITINGSTQTLGSNPSFNITAGVSSFNGRTGAVVPVANDYTFAQIAFKPASLAGYGIPASDVINTLTTVDGVGSNLDADFLDGQSGAYYLDYNNFTNKPTIPTANSQLTNDAGYVTQAGARTSLSAGTGLSYNSGTGVFTNTITNNNQLTNGNNYTTVAGARSSLSGAGLVTYDPALGVINGNTPTLDQVADVQSSTDKNLYIGSSMSDNIGNGALLQLNNGATIGTTTRTGIIQLGNTGINIWTQFGTSGSLNAYNHLTIPYDRNAVSFTTAPDISQALDIPTKQYVDNAGIGLPLISITASGSFSLNDGQFGFYIVSGSSGIVNLTLPSPSSCVVNGRTLPVIIKRLDNGAYAYNIKGNIDNVANSTLSIGNGESYTFYSTGTTWTVN